MSGNRVWFAVPTAVLLVVVGLALRPAEELPPGTVLSSRLEMPRIPHRCANGARTPFTPTAIDIQNVGKHYPIAALPRQAGGTPGVPPVSATHTVAWDAPGNKPGGKLGTIKLNAHTWPNGGALGNAMLASVHEGDLITLRNDKTKLCYRVTRMVEVDPYYDGDDFWTDEGPAQIAMLVCSGRRLGPGNWSHRTIWFATPYFGPGASSNHGQNAVHKTG